MSTTKRHRGDCEARVKSDRKEQEEDITYTRWQCQSPRKYDATTEHELATLQGFQEWKRWSELGGH